MEASSTNSRFRSRDHSIMENATRSGTDSDSDADLSSISADCDDELDLESMTAKGIKHLCSELLELKLASNEEFHKNISSNYSAFIRIFEEVKSLENEIVQLKNHLWTQKCLVKELVDFTCAEVLISEEIMEPNMEELVSVERHPPSELEDHINDISEILDLLLSESRIDEALDLIESEDQNFQKLKYENSLIDLSFYDSVISEKKAALILKLALLAENARVAAAELQKALYGLCRLGESRLANQLMLKYYHARIATGVRNLQSSKSVFNGAYIRELGKLVFSLIAQSARSFVMLHGETSPYPTELIQWTLEQTKVFVDCFNQYTKSISEISGGLSAAMEAAQISMSFCSLLETQRLVLLPFLIMHIRPSMEEVLDSHVEHFKKVISIYATNDAWVLDRYLVTGIMNDGFHSMFIGHVPEYCLLTSSGRKFTTMVQAIAEDVTPLVALQMEGLIFSGLINLYEEYVIILEKALIYEADHVTEKDHGSRINLAVSPQLQIAILANLSTLVQLFPRMVRGICEGIHQVNYDDRINEHTISYQHKELDDLTFFTREASSQLRNRFCQQYIRRIMSLETSCKLTPEICIDYQDEPCAFHHAMPSVAFQVLFLELRKLERLAEGNGSKKEWSLELLRELVEAIFVWIPANKEIWTTNEENLKAENSVIDKQFVMDLKFLEEITKYGGYFSNNPWVLEDLVKSAFLSAGLITERDFNYDNRSELDSINEVIQKLVEIEKTTIRPNDVSTGIQGDQKAKEHEYEFEADSIQDDATSFSEDSMGSDVNIVGSNLNAEICNSL